MTAATKKEIVDHVKYMATLMRKIEQSSKKLDSQHEVICGGCRHSGTIKNLSPELSKAASQLKQMLCYGYKEK